MHGDDSGDPSPGGHIAAPIVGEFGDVGEVRLEPCRIEAEGSLGGGA